MQMNSLFVYKQLIKRANLLCLLKLLKLYLICKLLIEPKYGILLLRMYNETFLYTIKPARPCLTIMNLLDKVKLILLCKGMSHYILLIVIFHIYGFIINLLIVRYQP